MESLGSMWCKCCVVPGGWSQKGGLCAGLLKCGKKSRLFEQGLGLT